MKSCLRRSRAKRIGALIGSGALLLVASGGAAGADGEAQLGGFSAVAVASGQRNTFAVTKYLVIQEFFDGTGPVAESTLDPQSGGESFASFPYPGATVLQYPAFVTLATGQTPPGYPLYVKATPTEEGKTLADPTDSYHLEAKASQDAAGSIARLRAGAGDAVRAGTGSTTSIVTEGGKAVATAESLTEGLSIGPLKVGSIWSKSVTTLTAGDSEPKTVTELHLDGGVVGDQRFSFGPSGLTVSEAGVPIPVSEGVESLNAALKPAGLSIRFLGPNPIAGGAEAGTFEVSAVREVPDGGTATLRMRFGQAITGIVPGGDFLVPLPTGDVSAPVEAGAPAPEPRDTPGLSDAIASAPMTEASPPASAFGSGFGADLSTSASPSSLGYADVALASPQVATGGDVAASTPDAGLAVPQGGGPVVRGTGRLAAADPRAVDGVYAAVAWATIAVLALSLIWRQGARKWTS